MMIRKVLRDVECLIHCVFIVVLCCLAEGICYLKKEKTDPDFYVSID